MTGPFRLIKNSVAGKLFRMKKSIYRRWKQEDTAPAMIIIGDCPYCNGFVYRMHDNFWGCSGIINNRCRFILGPEFYGLPLDGYTVSTLLLHEPTDWIYGFSSKFKSTHFSARLYLKYGRIKFYQTDYYQRDI